MKVNAFHKLSYGMYLVASEFDGKKSGYIANTVFQVTSEPAQVAISCHKSNFTTKVILDSGVFSVSVLKMKVNMKLIGDFGFMSSSGMEKFSGINYIKGRLGIPVVFDSSVAWFECKVTKSIDLGSHILVVGEVVDADLISDEAPLTYQYYREHYKMFSPKNSPTYLDQSALDAEIIPSPQEQLNPVAEHEHNFNGTSFVCVICGFTYNPEEGDPSVGIEPGTPFGDLPPDYRCPICNASKQYFKEI